MNLPPFLLALLGGTLLVAVTPASAARPGTAALTFCCTAQNDLYASLGKARYPRFATPLAAVEAAPPGSGVLLLADNYPASRTTLSPAGLDLARQKDLRLFIEYPAAVPGLDIAPPRSTTWERIVVSSDGLAPALPRLRILAAHDCHFVPVSNAPPAVLVVARVAGYDTAIYGIPDKDAFPILFEVPERKLMVATTRLSSFVTGRYAPAGDWLLVWEKILATLDPQHAHPLKATPVVGPAFSATAKLPRRFQRQAFEQSAAWFASSHLLVHPSEKSRLYEALAANAETAEPAGPDAPEGDGSLGILEGYASGILFDGNQLRRLPLRADCNLESAMVFALDNQLNRRKSSALIASNLLDFVYFTSGMCRGPRDDPKHGAFGLIGWGDIAPAWLVANYGDDNARSMLATAVAAAAMKSTRWDERLMRALLANLRTTGKLGFRTDRIDLPALEKNGWRPYYEGEPISYAPHFESYLWACYLWAYQHTGFRPFLDRSRTAIAMTMKAYPDQWRWSDNLERAHMLLCLAWLVRVEDTPEHRQWLDRVAGDLLACQQPSGAIHERLGRVHGGHYQTPQRNEDYGTGETPLLQQNGDPVSDQLYTSGFALLGLHEAVGATGDHRFKDAENRLAEYLCRIQTRSRKFPYLNGTWFRAFDDRRWEAWASSADVGWGAWSIESGWAQAWSAALLALREQHTTVWEFTAKTRVRDHFERLKAQMLPDSP
ncbi:MAG TPA: hypothetical protein P5205_13235 [Candidatus Paceibacterota bacterium]|nr:hypothetical protein [Verrucomicrobiota bacterium]HSA11325.1 hypothetical protein [Candidatus Paceibacterota bacterium]